MFSGLMSGAALDAAMQAPPVADAVSQVAVNPMDGISGSSPEFSGIMQPSAETSTVNQGGLAGFFRNIDNKLGEFADMMDLTGGIKEKLGIPDPLAKAPGWLRFLGRGGISVQGKNGGFSIGNQNKDGDPFTKMALIKSLMNKRTSDQPGTVEVNSNGQNKTAPVPAKSPGEQAVGPEAFGGFNSPGMSHFSPYSIGNRGLQW